MRMEQVVTHIQWNCATNWFAILFYPDSHIDDIMPEEWWLSLLLFHHSCPTSSLFPPSLLFWHPLNWETGPSTWFIMCVRVRLASPVLLWLPPGVIQSSPLLNPAAKSQWFRPPWTIWGLLSICHGKACQNHTYRSLSTRLWLSGLHLVLGAKRRKCYS